MDGELRKVVESGNKLFAASTQGEWLPRPYCSAGVEVFNAADFEKWNGKAGPALWHDNVFSGWSAKEADCDFVAFVHNNWPKIAAALAEQERRG